MGQLITNIEKNRIFQDILINNHQISNIKRKNNGQKKKKTDDIVQYERKNK